MLYIVKHVRLRCYAFPVEILVYKISNNFKKSHKYS